MLMSQLIEKAEMNLQEAWASLIEIDPILEDFEVNPQFLQMVSPNETVVVVSLTTQIGEVSGMINICIPHIVLEPIIPKLSVHYWMETGNKERNPETYEQLTKHIKHVQVEAKAELGDTMISINELLNLKKNDVIKLNNNIDKALKLV